MQIISAENIALADIHGAMMDAYSDYVVPLQMELPQFETMVRMRGFGASLSMLAVEEGRIAAFWITGVEPQARPGDAYAVTVGTCVAHRRKGLAQKLYGELAPRARTAGLSRIILEVVEDNDKAVSLYEGLGFEKTSRVEIFKGTPPSALVVDGITFKQVSVKEAHDAGISFREWRPTWQNDTPAMEYVSDDIHACVALKGGKAVAYGMVHTTSGAVTQIAVDAKWRRKHIAAAMLTHWAEAFGLETMGAGNIPDTDKASMAFYRSLGWDNHVNQFVMAATL